MDDIYPIERDVVPGCIGLGSSQACESRPPHHHILVARFEGEAAYIMCDEDTSEWSGPTTLVERRWQAHQDEVARRAQIHLRVSA